MFYLLREPMFPLPRTLAMENAMLQMKCWHVMSAVSAPPDPFSPYMSMGYLPYSPAFAPVQNGKQGRVRPARENGVTIPEPEFGVAESGSDEPDLPGCPYVTVMLRNLPNNYSRAMLLELLDSEGFAGQYDFFYLPMDFKSRASLGLTCECSMVSFHCFLVTVSSFFWSRLRLCQSGEHGAGSPFPCSL